MNVTSLSTFQVLDTVQTIAFNSECPKQGGFLHTNANFLRDPETSDRDRRAAFKTVVRLTKEVYNFGKGFKPGDRDILEQSYYMLQDAASADRTSK